MTNTAPDGGSVPRFEMRHRLALALEWGHASVAEMADELGVHRNTVSRYLNDPEARVTRGTMRVWALRTGVPLEWIQYGIEPTANEPVAAPNKPRKQGKPKTACNDAARVIAFPTRTDLPLAA